MYSIVQASNFHKPRFLYIPESYDPSIIPDKWKDYACYILSVINQRLVFEKLPPDEFVPLMSQLLIRVLPSRHYKRILDLLQELNVIECDPRYQVGKKSKSYRLTDEYRGQAHQRYQPTNPELIRKLDNLKADMESGIVLPVHRYLYRWLQCLELDYPGDIKGFGIHWPLADDIINGNFRLCTCQFGRVHTNLTNLKREMRYYLKYQGRELSTIDIANSQPLFLGVLCLNHHQNKGELNTVYQFKAVKPDLTDTNLKERERETSIMYRHSTLDCTLPSDLERYLNLCERGAIYEYLMQEAKVHNREAIKKMFFQVLFANLKVQRHIRLNPILERQFPTIMRAIGELKRKDYKQASALLTRTESAFMFNQVVRRLMNEAPDTFVSTIHDSIVTTTDQVPAVTAMILDEFKRLCGLQPTLKAERLVRPRQAIAG